MEKVILFAKKFKKEIIAAVFAVFIVSVGIYKFGQTFTILSVTKDNNTTWQIGNGRFPRPNPTNTPGVDPEITLIFTGDVIPGRSVNRTMVQKNDFTYPFSKTADFIKNADLTVINLEAPLVTGCPVTDTGMIFCGDTRFIDGLLFSGVDIATLANNHAGNYGKEGVDQTVALLNSNGIETTGIHNIVYKEVKGVRFAFLGYNGVSPFLDYLSSIDENKIRIEVEEARKNSDVVIVMYHWSSEYSPFPVSDSIAPFNPIEIAHLTIDSGADLIIGNHPHWVQGYEEYKGKMIFYALGNFVFDQMWSWDTRIGTVLKTNFKGKNLDNFELFPVMIEDYSQPYFLEGEEKDQVLELINERRVVN